MRTVLRRSFDGAGLTALSVVAAVALLGATLAGRQAGSRPDAAATPQIRSQASEFIRAPWTGDLDGMIPRRIVRLLTPYSRTDYFIDNGVPRGLVHDSSLQLEQELNRRLKTTTATRVHVVVIPMPREELYTALVNGLGDVIATGITITPERRTRVDFTVAIKTNVREILVTGPGAPAIHTLRDLSERELWVRNPGNRMDSVSAVNGMFAREGRAPIVVKSIPMALDDDDVLEMVNAGLVKAVIADDFSAEFWRQILPNLTLRPDIVFRERGDLAWAVRKNSPKLLAMLDPIVEANRVGTLWGNVTFRKYLESTQFVRHATGGQERRRFDALVALFRKYGEKYQIDHLLMMAQGYQESRLDQRARSRVGAIGIMQVMPETARDLGVGDVRQVESNIHAGVKYIRSIIDTHFNSEPMGELTKTIFAFAAYNCGPARLRQLRDEAARRGLNPNVWFGHVERIAGERLGRETVQYVSNIYKYYLAYTMTTGWQTQ